MYLLFLRLHLINLKFAWEIQIWEKYYKRYEFFFKIYNFKIREINFSDLELDFEFNTTFYYGRNGGEYFYDFCLWCFQKGMIQKSHKLIS